MTEEKAELQTEQPVEQQQPVQEQNSGFDPVAFKTELLTEIKTLFAANNSVKTRPLNNIANNQQPQSESELQSRIVALEKAREEESLAFFESKVKSAFSSNLFVEAVMEQIRAAPASKRDEVFNKAKEREVNIIREIESSKVKRTDLITDPETKEKRVKEIMRVTRPKMIKSELDEKYGWSSDSFKS